jgi:hypothetical protein
MEPRSVVAMELLVVVDVETVEEGAYLHKPLAEFISRPSHELSLPRRFKAIDKDVSAINAANKAIVSSIARS